MKEIVIDESTLIGAVRVFDGLFMGDVKAA